MKKDSKNWIVAGRTDGFGARMAAFLNAMVVAKLTGLSFKFSWVAPENAPYLAKYNKNLENNQVLIPMANLPHKEELFSAEFLSTYGLDDSYIGNTEEIPNYSITSLKDFKQEAPLPFGWYMPQGMLSDLDKKTYCRISKECWEQIDFSPDAKKMVALSLKKAKPIKGKFVALHIRAGDIVYGDTWAAVVCPKTAFSVYLAMVLAREELQKGHSIVLFSDDLHASAFIKRILNAEMVQSAKNSTQVYCIDDFFERDLYAGYLQILFEVVFMAQAKKICSSGASGFSSLAMRIGVAEQVAALEHFTQEEQIQIITDSIPKYDFHRAHKAYGQIQLWYLGISLKKGFQFLHECAYNAFMLYPTNFNRIVYLGMLLKSGDYVGADALLANAYHSDNAGFFEKFIESKAYGEFFSGIPTACARIFDVQRPYLAYYVFKMAIFILNLEEDKRLLIPNHTIFLEYLYDYARIANFLLKVCEMQEHLAAGGGAYSPIFADLLNALKFLLWHKA